ncbi:Saccharopine dehydrogenase NADP binding domain-containing protein [Gracilibacillus orientalis]|uniref:Saccharopine dehydrogenase NADP binding domain-containing protein n=1 Tax=Gracilibacillus orientalis TaxID=334253 RepID=A0A1I4JUC6_9BACI|nr:saccharopine dehydrogenase NADP-binding domain-containing protein [Gracilibacillus orientalis]SFL70130.1 Saccharopine dehydrogenase NADP binding domain-containing protein [Gracilibacillus orientalis]
MKDAIIVIGGYGKVGQMICKILAKQFPGRVYAAGRNKDKAIRFANETNNVVQPLVFDMHQTEIPSWLLDAKLVMMCIDQPNTRFMQACLQNGTAYIDITADRHFLIEARKLEKEDILAPAVLSVGLIPGLSNLLANHVKELMPAVHQLDIDVLLGLGDDHGEAALKWMLDQIHSHFIIYQKENKVWKIPFSDKKLTNFGSVNGKKHTHRFPFPDQLTLYHTLKVPSVSTRICFDSNFITTIFAWFCRWKLSRLLQLPFFQQIFLFLLKKWRFGSKQFSVHVSGYHENSNESITLYGEEESVITAQVAASVATAILTNNFNPDIYHIDQLFRLNYQENTLYLEAKQNKNIYYLCNSIRLSYF